MTGTKTNERPGVRAQHRHARFSASKAREVLDLIRGKSVAEARTILQFCDRAAAESVAKVLDSAVANAANNNDIPPGELFVATCYADEGPTLKRWRPRARGRATRINKRTCHITVIVGRYSSEELDRIRDRQARTGRAAPDASASRARRVARSRAKESDDAVDAPEDEAAVDAESDTDTDTRTEDGAGSDTTESTDAADGSTEVGDVATDGSSDDASDNAEAAADSAVEDSAGADTEEADEPATEQKDEN